MKRILLIIYLGCLPIPGFSQACEEREPTIVQGMTTFSAALLYNTYGVIGSISDAFGSDVYTARTVTDLLTAQKKMLDNLTAFTERLSSENILQQPSDKAYFMATASILKGLKKQAELMLEYARSKTPQRLENYEAQRNKNWIDISKLMGLKE